MDENGEYGREPTERERSAAEMEALHQAMMEELGIGRKDALPLEDRAASVSIVPLTFTHKRVAPENPASVWHNLNLDDAEPGSENLEDIAGGQLYRLRRGGSGLSNGGRGGHSAGRGRGGASNRGGHASVGGRGNFAPRGRNVDHSRSGQSQPYFNDARRGGKSAAKVDAGIARLQREAESSRMRRTEGRSVKIPQSAPKSTKPSIPAASPVVARAAPAVARPTVSKFKLAPPSTFLSHNKISSSQTTKVAAPVVSAPQPSPASNLAPQGGLAASQWASTPDILVDTSEPSHSDPVATPVAVMNTPEANRSVRSATSAFPTTASDPNHSIQSTTDVTPLTVVTNGVAIHQTPAIIRTVVDERPVKVRKNNSTAIKQGFLRLIKFDEKSPLTLELQIENVIHFSELLTDTATLKADANIVTYRADPTTEQTPTWKFVFQLPGPAKSFVNYHFFKLSELRRNGGSCQSSEQGSNTAIIPPSPVPSSPVPLSAISSSTNTPSRNDVSYFTNRISSSTFADLAELSGQETLFSLNEEEAAAEDNQPATYSSLQDLLSLIEGEIVEGTLQVLNANHGGSFFDHVSQLAKGVGLENDAYFMKHAKNVFIGGLSSSRYSTSKPILSVTEELVADFLKGSETLQRFPQEFIDTYIREISKKILDQAQNPQSANQSEDFRSVDSFNTVEASKLVDMSANVEVVKPAEPVKCVAEAAIPVEVAKPVEVVKHVVAVESTETVKHATLIKCAGASDVIPKQKRITYSIEEMMNMRPGATCTRSVLDARDSLQKYLPGHKLQYKDSRKATAAKIKPSEWKTRFAATASNDEAPRGIQKDNTLEEQTPGQISLAPASLSVGSTNHAPSEGIDRQDPFDKEHGTSFPKLSPAEWKNRFGTTPRNDASLKVTKVKKEVSTTGKDERIENGVLESISAENSVKKPSAVTRHQSLSDNSSSASLIAPQAPTRNVLKDFNSAAEGQVGAKMVSGNDASPPVLPSNRGLSTSRYATPDVVNQAAVLRASSNYKHPLRQVVSRQDSSNRSSGSSTQSRSTQVHDTVLWETLLSSKQKQPSIKVESPALKNEPNDFAFTPELDKSIPMTVSRSFVPESNPTVPPTRALSIVDTGSNSKQVFEFNDKKQAQAPTAALETAEWSTVNRSGNHMAKTVDPQEVNPVALDNVTEKEKTVPKLVFQLPSRSRHIATNSDIDRLAQVLSNLDVKTEKENDVVAKVLPVPERSTSPTIEEILEKKRASGLATSKWASPQAPVFKPLSRTPQTIPAGYNQPSLNMPQHDRVFSPQNGYNPAMQAQSPYGDFSRHRNQYPPVLSTILVEDPSTGNVSELTGISVGTHFPVVAHTPPAYVAHSPHTPGGFTSAGPVSFPARPTMFDKSFSDSDSEEVLKATAPVFTPSRQRDGSAMNRPALSPVRNRQNSQQEAIQARLNKSLAEPRM